MSTILEGIDLPKDSIGIELVFIPKDGDIINNESMSIGAALGIMFALAI